jgi:hypothetical protein
MWSPAGNELFYVNGQHELVAVGLSGEANPVLGAPEVLFSVVGYEYEVGRSATYGVASDGERFIMIKDPAGEAATLIVVQGLFTELKEAEEEGG